MCINKRRKKLRQNVHIDTVGRNRLHNIWHTTGHDKTGLNRSRIKHTCNNLKTVLNESTIVRYLILTFRHTLKQGNDNTNVLWLSKWRHLVLAINCCVAMIIGRTVINECSVVVTGHVQFTAVKTRFCDTGRRHGLLNIVITVLRLVTRVITGMCLDDSRIHRRRLTPWWRRRCRRLRMTRRRYAMLWRRQLRHFVIVQRLRVALCLQRIVLARQFLVRVTLVLRRQHGVYIGCCVNCVTVLPRDRFLTASVYISYRRCSLDVRRWRWLQCTEHTDWWHSFTSRDVATCRPSWISVNARWSRMLIFRFRLAPKLEKIPINVWNAKTHTSWKKNS